MTCTLGRTWILGSAVRRQSNATHVLVPIESVRCLIHLKLACHKSMSTGHLLVRGPFHMPRSLVCLHDERYCAFRADVGSHLHYEYDPDSGFDYMFIKH